MNYITKINNRYIKFASELNNILLNDKRFSRFKITYKYDNFIDIFYNYFTSNENYNPKHGFRYDLNGDLINFYIYNYKNDIF